MAKKSRRGIRSELQSRARGEFEEEPSWYTNLVAYCLRLSRQERRAAIRYLLRLIDSIRASLEDEGQH